MVISEPWQQIIVIYFLSHISYNILLLEACQACCLKLVAWAFTVALTAQSQDGHILQPQNFNSGRG